MSNNASATVKKENNPPISIDFKKFNLKTSKKLNFIQR